MTVRAGRNCASGFALSALSSTASAATKPILASLPAVRRNAFPNFCAERRLATREFSSFGRCSRLSTKFPSFRPENRDFSLLLQVGFEEHWQGGSKLASLSHGPVSWGQFGLQKSVGGINAWIVQTHCCLGSDLAGRAEPRRLCHHQLCRRADRWGEPADLGT